MEDDNVGNSSLDDEEQSVLLYKDASDAGDDMI